MLNVQNESAFSWAAQIRWIIELKIEISRIERVSPMTGPPAFDFCGQFAASELLREKVKRSALDFAAERIVRRT